MESPIQFIITTSAREFFVQYAGRGPLSIRKFARLLSITVVKDLMSRGFRGNIAVLTREYLEYLYVHKFRAEFMEQLRSNDYF